jgi:FAD/FMN-containing dehydrogenase/Fe-S oxidoreductase
MTRGEGGSGAVGLGAGEATALAGELRRELRGAVRFDLGARAAFSTDASNFRHVPLGVVLPRDREDLVAAVEICRRHGAPVVARGGGTSLAGQAANEAVVLDCSRHLTRIVELDPARRLARVEPGVVLDDLRRAAAAHGLTFGPDPTTHDRATLGGMIANDACGPHSVRFGRTSSAVVALDALLADGTRLRCGATPEDRLAALCREPSRTGFLYRGLVGLVAEHAEEVRARLPAIPRRVSGYHLDALLPEQGFHLARALVGSEGTLALVLEATVELVEALPERSLVVVATSDLPAAADLVPALLALEPFALEAVDARIVERAPRRPGWPRGGGYLLVELAPGQAPAVVAEARDAGADAVVLEGRAEQAEAWRVREAALAGLLRAQGTRGASPGAEDAAVDPRVLGRYLREFEALVRRFGYTAGIYGHFGDGCVHARVDFDLATSSGVRRYRRFLEEAADLVIAYGGSLSGEHGDGQQRGELLGRMFGERLLGAFGVLKALFDPEGLLNPGRLVDPRPLDADLRLGPAWAPVPLRTTLAYPEDEGSFPTATARCVGAGVCRRTEGGTMCPSFMATRDEEHSTRGRARLLFEMTSGVLSEQGWRSEAVHEALALCLGCKACKAECPAGVDMARYRSEFLHQHYRGRLRPRASFAFGLAPIWLRLAGLAPRWSSRAAGLRSLRRLLARAAGAAPDAPLPRPDPEPFHRTGRRLVGGAAGDAPEPARRARRDSSSSAGGRRALLLVDELTDVLDPGVARAALAVLGAAGFEVEVVGAGRGTGALGRICCGRPLLEEGMLALAGILADRLLDALAGPAAGGVPLVVLEPSCASALVDELPALRPRDSRAGLVAGAVRTLGRALEEAGWQPPALEGEVVVHPHCHARAVLAPEGDLGVLERTGATLRVLDAGCCGMAGAFGYRSDSAAVARRIAAGRLAPAVRALAPEAFLVADGISCRTQIAETTGRRAVALAELLAAGLG